MEIFTRSRFDRRYKKLSPQLKALAKEKEALFRVEPFAPQLRTHKLHGKDTGARAFWINNKYRIKFIVSFLALSTRRGIAATPNAAHPNTLRSAQGGVWVTRRVNALRCRS
ncbi:MAG: hypothetical protein AAB699_01985 [Patescibacteria group bacterium]